MCWQGPEISWSCFPLVTGGGERELRVHHPLLMPSSLPPQKKTQNTHTQKQQQANNLDPIATPRDPPYPLGCKSLVSSLSTHFRCDAPRNIAAPLEITPFHSEGWMWRIQVLVLIRTFLGVNPTERRRTYFWVDLHNECTRDALISRSHFFHTYF